MDEKMENKMNDEMKHPEGCRCYDCMGYDHMRHMHMNGMCCHGYMGGHKLIKIIIGLIILVVVFWAGVKIGEIGALYGVYSPRGIYMMRGISPDSWYGMMGGYYALPTSTTAAPTK